MLPVEISYSLFKAFVQAKSLKVQYVEFNNAYHLYAVDNSFCISAAINKTKEPANTLDFENTFKPTANAAIKDKVSLHDGSDNALTSQTSGAKRALDVGITIGGAHVDPRLPYQGYVTLVAFTATSASQIALAANTARKYLIIHNPSSNIMWFSFGTSAVANTPSIKLVSNSTYVMEGSFMSTQAIHVIRNAALNIDFTIGEGT